MTPDRPRLLKTAFCLSLPFPVHCSPLTLRLLAMGVSSAFHYTGTDALNAVAQLELYEEDATGRVLLEAHRGPSTLGASVSQTGAIHVAAVSRHVTRRAFFLGS